MSDEARQRVVKMLGDFKLGNFKKTKSYAFNDFYELGK